MLTAYIAVAQKPNIVYIMVDDMGYADLSSFGQKSYQTPHIDKLASQGMKFVNAYSAGAVCTPTRAAFMTGRYPSGTTVGLYEPLTGGNRDKEVGITPDTPSIAQQMKSAGYETALIGKWHLGCQPQHSPVKNGFDYFFGFLNGAADYTSHNTFGGIPDLYENDVAISRKGYLTDLFTEKALEIIQSKKSKPFFLALMYNAPHWPWQGPGDPPYPDTVDFRKGGSPDTYAAMMKSLDNSIGRILQAMEAQKLLQNTLIIFTNDNGGEKYSNNGGFSKAKSTLWEGGIRVPAFVVWHGKIKPGSSTEQLAITMDWTKTILAAANSKGPSSMSDGINLLPILTGKSKVIDRDLYWRTSQHRKQKAMRLGDWKWLVDDSGEYLFNLKNDPGESNNLKDVEPKILTGMKSKYSVWEKNALPPAL
ncbi:MAG TPA: sulfatase-like hydrolase/transferase [Chryseolinea sp.]